MAISIRTPGNRSYASSFIANELGRGDAIADKIHTVLNDLRDVAGVKVLDKISEEHIEQMKEYYLERVNEGELSKSTATDYVSALNSALEVVGKSDLKVSASELGFSKESSSESKGVDQAIVQEFKEFLQEKAVDNLHYEALYHSVTLMEEFGLRWREGVSIKILEKDIEGQVLHLSQFDGTKNGRERDIAIESEEQREALAKAQEFVRENGWHSLIDPDMKREEWRSFSYRAIAEFNRETGHKINFHALRHNFATERYYSLREDGLSDEEARMVVSNELGHNRLNVTDNYIKG